MIIDLFKNVRDRMENKDDGADETKVSIPSNLLFKCPRCQKVVFMEEFEKSWKICVGCGYHSRLTALERLNITVDKGSFVEINDSLTSKNPLKFPGYDKKIEQLMENTGLSEAVITGECCIRKNKAVIGIMDSHFMMASMGSVVGEKLTRAFEYATAQQLPIIIFTASGGARMQEGIISLMQMAKTSGAAGRHSDAGLLYITVITDPTTGGVTASFASLGDVIIAEPKVLIGFAGRRVIEDTIKQRLPAEFQSAEFLKDHGFIDMIVNRTHMRRTLSTLIQMHY
ncbi:MAG: acetyl-CoA carboxylase, carboxyltransferase subunit beta [Oscillospiraceae bacterium]|nr:acetyl-CoA carboxylase, carboxyltransferase subunit beta [Oscillospiraceae bacterium]